jgi:hypothetical protein
MSMEAYALCARQLDSAAAWQAAIDALGFDLHLRAEKIPPASSGHLPATRHGRSAGFECSIVPLSELTDLYPEIDFGGPWACVYAFYFGTISESIGALIAIAACLEFAGGLAFFPQEDRLLTADQAIQYARDTVPVVEDLEKELGGRAE